MSKGEGSGDTGRESRVATEGTPRGHTLSMIISFNPYNDLGEMNHYPHFTEQKTKFREGR